MRGEASARQIRVLVFVAALAPIVALPGLVAQKGGALGWLAPIAAIPLVVMGFFLFRALGPEGLAATLRERWGWLGRVVSVLYYLWAMALAALTAGQCVDRLGRTDYANASPWLLSLALGVAAWYLTAHGRGAFLRAVEIFYLILLVALGLFFILGVWNLEPENLRPQAVGEAAGVFSGLLPTMGTLAVGSLAAFFPREERSAKRKGWAAVWWCLAAGGVCLLVIGTLGSKLTAELPLSFFVALQGIGLPGGFQRLEGLGTAVWVLSDLTLLGAAALAGRLLAGDRKWGVWPVLLAGLVGGGLLTGKNTEPFMGPILWLELVFGAALPIFLWLTPKKNRKRKKA